jgi:mRNA degradation ribonuclease J1/J2
MCGTDLKELITRINPKTLFPIHTEHPGMFRFLSAKTKMVKEARTYAI